MEEKQQKWPAYIAIILASVAIVVGAYLAFTMPGLKSDLTETMNRLDTLETKSSASQSLPSAAVPLGDPSPNGGIPVGKTINCSSPAECEQLIREIDPNAQFIEGPLGN